MKEKSPYLRSDMAADCCSDLDLAQGVRGIRFVEDSARGIPVTRLEITDEEGEKIIGKPRGSYVTVSVGKIWLAGEAAFEKAVSVLAGEIRKLAEALSPSLGPVLVAGLGNREITSDAVGPLTVQGLTVTRHIRDLNPSLFDRLFSLPLAALAPGVVGQTGIETVEILRGASQSVSPSLIVAVDALASKSVDRLATTVQLSDTGIAPGSGIGNRRKAVDRETLGVPVLSVGIPTVVDSSTLICDMLERAGMEEIPPALREELENGKSFFVTPKDIDVAVAELSRLLSRAINAAFASPQRETAAG